MIQRIFSGLLISFNGIAFHSRKESSYNLLTQEHWRLIIFFCILTFFRPPCLKSEHKVSFFLFGLEGHKKVFCILSSSLIISVGTFDINERKFLKFLIIKAIYFYQSWKYFFDEQIIWREISTFFYVKDQNSIFKVYYHEIDENAEQKRWIYLLLTKYFLKSPKI